MHFDIVVTSGNGSSKTVARDYDTYIPRPFVHPKDTCSPVQATCRTSARPKRTALSHSIAGMRSSCSTSLRRSMESVEFSRVASLCGKLDVRAVAFQCAVSVGVPAESLPEHTILSRLFVTANPHHYAVLCHARRLCMNHEVAGRHLPRVDTGNVLQTKKCRPGSLQELVAHRSFCFGSLTSLSYEITK